VTKRSLEQFAAEMVHQPDYLPEACFIALKAGEFIGYSNLSITDQGFNTEMTGVLPTYRKRGVATLLKLYGIRYAQTHGNGRLDTQNDSVNEAMIALNEKLGFVREGATLRFMKRIS
jgi:mycothiol synthase